MEINNIPRRELLNVMEDQGKETLFRIIYNTSGKKLVPKDFEKCWMTQIPKKRNPRKCEDHRIIS